MTPTSSAAAISIDGLDIQYSDIGTGPAVLFLHGYDGPLVESEFLSRLAHTHRVIAPIHPGFASTPTSRDMQDVHNVALLYLELLDKLGVESVDIVGHSLGGMLGAEVAAIAPSRIRHLALISPFGMWFDAHPVPDLLSAGGSFLAKLVWADPERDTAHQATTNPIERTQNIASASNYLWPIPDRGLTSRLYRLRMPLLLVRGEADAIISDGHLREWGALLPESTFETIPAAGHFPMIENEDGTIQVVESFLAR